MSMDKRIETNFQPMYGCHSYFDKYMKEKRGECNVKIDIDSSTEKGCEGCERKVKEQK